MIRRDYTKIVDEPMGHFFMRDREWAICGEARMSPIRPSTIYIKKANPISKSLIE